MNEKNSRYVRLRYTATGALVTLAAVGAIVVTVANGSTTKGPAAPVGKSNTSQPVSGGSAPATSPQPFLIAAQHLVDDGTISASQGEVLDRAIQAGRIDTQALASSGFTQAQLQAVDQALGNVKRALAPSGTSPAPGASAPAPGGKANVSPQPADRPFLTDVARLVNDGTISASEGQTVDGEIRAGQIDTQTLASSGFTPAQLQAVQAALSNTKRAQAG